MLGHAEALDSMTKWPEGYPDEAQNEQVRMVLCILTAGSSVLVRV